MTNGTQQVLRPLRQICPDDVSRALDALAVAPAHVQRRGLTEVPRESQALIDRELGLSRARLAAASIPQPVVIESDPSRKPT